MKRSEYETAAQEWREFLVVEGQKPIEEQAFPMSADEWLSAPAHATCATPTCVNYGVTFPCVVHENADGVYRVICGRCSQPSAVVLDLEDDDE